MYRAGQRIRGLLARIHDRLEPSRDAPDTEPGPTPTPDETMRARLAAQEAIVADFWADAAERVPDGPAPERYADVHVRHDGTLRYVDAEGEGWISTDAVMEVRR